MSKIPSLLYVRCGMIGIGRGGISPSGTPMDTGYPATMSSPSCQNILTLSGSTISLIGIGICASTSGGRNIRGGGGSDDDDA